MSHMIESYATVCGLKIDKPYIQTQFFPLEFERYIIVNSGGRAAGKLYPFYNDVINLLSPILEKEGIKIIQIGSKDDIQIQNVKDLREQTSLHQSAYLIQNCELILGNDSSCIHIASGFDKKIVVLFGTTAPAQHGPFFGNKDNQISIESHRNGNKPSFASDESPRTIRFIKPEEVVKSVLKLLNIQHEINKNTIFIGDHYPNQIVEVVPDMILNDPNFLPGAVLTIRADLLCDENIIYQNLSIRKYVLLINRPLNINALRQLKLNIASVVYEINDDHDITFCKDVIKSGIPLSLISYLPEKEISKILLEYFDLPLIQKRTLAKKSDIEAKINKYNNTTSIEYLNENQLFKSSKLLLSRGKWYLGDAYWKIQKECNPGNPCDKVLLDNQDWLNDHDFYAIWDEKSI